MAIRIAGTNLSVHTWGFVTIFSLVWKQEDKLLQDGSKNFKWMTTAAFIRINHWYKRNIVQLGLDLKGPNHFKKNLINERFHLPEHNSHGEKFDFDPLQL